jgi:hypothetical protein
MKQQQGPGAINKLYRSESDEPIVGRSCVGGSGGSFVGGTDGRVAGVAVSAAKAAATGQAKDSLWVNRISHGWRAILTSKR